VTHRKELEELVNRLEDTRAGLLARQDRGEGRPLTPDERWELATVEGALSNARGALAVADAITSAVDFLAECLPGAGRGI